MTRLEHTINYITLAVNEEFKFYRKVWVQPCHAGKGKIRLLFTFFGSDDYRMHSMQFNNFTQLKESAGHFVETPAFVEQLKNIIEHLTDAHYKTSILQKLEITSTEEFGQKYAESIARLPQFDSYRGYSLYSDNTITIYHDVAQFDKAGKAILDKEGNQKVNEVSTTYTHEQWITI